MAQDELNQSVIVMCIILVISAFFTVTRALLFEISGARVVARLRRELFSAVIRQEVGFFDMNKTGELINRISADCVSAPDTIIFPFWLTRTHHRRSYKLQSR